MSCKPGRQDLCKTKVFGDFPIVANRDSHRPLSVPFLRRTFVKSDKNPRLCLWCGVEGTFAAVTVIPSVYIIGGLLSCEIPGVQNIKETESGLGGGGGAHRAHS